jgi:putative DNA primase/helicase
MSWNSPGWKTAAAEYHANRPELKVVNRVVNGGDPRADISPATSPKEFGYNSKPKPNGDAAAFESGRASGFQMTAIEWLWPNRFAIGKLGIIAGLPDEGKGQILCDIAARITSENDKSWPCNEGVAPQGNVMLFSAEDDFSDTVVPRLAAAGADLNRIELVKMVREAGKTRMFSLVSDLELLRQKIIEVENVKLLLIDPISAYLGHGKIDSFRTTDVRAVLGPLVDLAAELKIAIIAIMHFNKKVDITNALLRISDSLAFGAAARHVYGVVPDPENNRKLFVRAKNNLSTSSKDKALAYRFGARIVGNDNGKEIWAPHILWELNYVDVTASEAMQAAADNKSPGAAEAAKSLLLELLADGPVEKKQIEEAAEAHMISATTLRRAREALKVETKKEPRRRDGAWFWRLPEKCQPWPWEAIR